MKRSYVCPANFTLKPGKVEWAMEEYNISREEVERQTKNMRMHEFQRPYGAWNLVWHRWFEKADEKKLFKRERKYKSVEKVTPEMRADDQRKFDEQIKRFQGK